MRIWKDAGLLAGLIVFVPFMTSGQVNGWWGGLKVEKKIISGLTAEVEGQARFYDGSGLKSWLADGGLEYKVNKYVSAGVFYRHIRRRKFDNDLGTYSYSTRHRFYGNINVRYKVTDWLRVEYRFRYQNQFKDDQAGIVATGSYFRHRLELAYKTKSPFSPYLSADVFYQIKAGFDQVRYKAGCDYDINKRNSVGIACFADYTIPGMSRQGQVVAVQYGLKLKSAKTKKQRA